MATVTFVVFAAPTNGDTHAPPSPNLGCLHFFCRLNVGIRRASNGARVGPGNDTCPTDLTALLSDVTMYGVASWGGNWVEYHNPNGTSVLASDNFSNLKRGTWSSDACLEVCYAYPDGGGWCPQWQEVEGGWVNLQPETGEVVHYIYLFQAGDPLNLEQLMERHDAQANRI